MPLEAPVTRATIGSRLMRTKLFDRGDLQGLRDGGLEPTCRLPARGGAARRRAGDAARALLRPRLRAGDHAVHDADVARPELVGTGAGPAGPRRSLVVLGRLRLADQRDRP